jgi:hypothetical protein
MLSVTHGVVCNKDPNLISHALLADEKAYCAYLHARRSSFVSLDEAMRGRGDALTVDDATHAGLRAVTLAIQSGHEVSWCVNGDEVEFCRSYFPFQISSMLDRTSKRSCSFLTRQWDLSTPAHLRSFRFHLKQEYLRLDSRPAIEAFVSSLSDALEIDPRLSRTLQTVGREEIALASSLGCTLLNHGWTHINPNALTQRGLEAHITRNAEWLSSFQPNSRSFYVPPYGRMVPHARTMDLTILLADRTLRSDHDYPAINRQDLICESQAEEDLAHVGLEAAA